ncbi:MAG: PIG-L family deacetylase, partial [Spirochaetales bacterium]|nr:PIG-L family deacetylase [Spirochaetales bacterium]
LILSRHASQGNPEGESAAKEKREIRFPIWWIFLLPIAALCVFLLPKFKQWLGERKEAAATSSVRCVQLNLSWSPSTDGEMSRSFETFPIKVAASGAADLLLPKPGIQKGARTFAVSKDDHGVVQFESRGIFIINGVGAKTKILKPGDRIAFGHYRIIFDGISYRDEARPAVPVPRSLLLSLLIFVFAALIVVFRAPVTITLPVRSGADLSVSADELLTVPDETVSKKGPEPSAADGPPANPDGTRPRVITGFPTVMWAPGIEPDYFKVDALFVHAHPDDESLDFGVLISRFAAAGMKVAVVLMTDGNSGLDQYPQRIENDRYPPYDLRGSALAEVRVIEAQSALEILGAHHYVRLGLMNHPYGSGLDVLSAFSVTNAWGGEDALVSQLSALILGYRPDVVISPEGPAEAFEHFEHEATGRLVEKTLSGLAESGLYLPKGRLVSIDPLQRAMYSDTIGIRADVEHPQSGLNHRGVQIAALSEHVTQRDASIIGVENLSGFDREYYRMLDWSIMLPIEEYLRDLSF